MVRSALIAEGSGVGFVNDDGYGSGVRLTYVIKRPEVNGKFVKIEKNGWPSLRSTEVGVDVVGLATRNT